MDITKTRCTVVRRGRSIGYFNVDTIFIDGIPHVVFEWETQPDGAMIPRCLVELDPQYFHPLPGWKDVKHLYELPVTDPLVFD